MTSPTPDPFATQEKVPSISFKEKPIGTTYTGKVVEAPQFVQARDYLTGDLDFWPDGNKKMTVVTGLEINGERFNLWAPKPSALFRACSEAQEKAGSQIAVGGTLTITFTGEQPNENPRLNAQKLYSVVYQPNNPFAEPQINPQTGEVSNQGPMPDWAQPAPTQQPAYAAQPAQQFYGPGQNPAPQSAGSVQPMQNPYQAAQPQQAKQHSAEVLAALRAAGIDPASVPVQ